MDNLKQFAVQTYTSIRALLHNGLAVLGAVAAMRCWMGARPVVEHSGSRAGFRRIRHDTP